MSDIDLAITHSKRLESLLEQKLGASGKGLHEKVSSVETRLPRELIRKLRLVATIRNKIVHESDYKSIDDRAAFLKASKDSERELNAIGRKSSGMGKWMLLLGALALILTIVLVYKVWMHH